MISTEKIIFPLLDHLEDENDHTLDECVNVLAKKFDLSEEDLKLKYNKKPNSKSEPREQFRTRVRDRITMFLAKK